MDNSYKFAEMLRGAIYQIRLHENNKPIGVIQDELGYSLEKTGGSAIEYWRKGNIPKLADLEALTKELIRRGGLERAWVEQFLTIAGYPFPEKLCEKLFPQPTATNIAPTSLPENSEYGLPPKPYRIFIDREEILNQAVVAMREPDSYWVVAIDGVGGMGKTAVAYEIAEMCLQKNLFSDVLWINAAEYADHQGGSLFTFETVLDAIGSYFRLPDFQSLAQLEKCRRSKVFLDQEERLLLVLDSLHTAAEPQDQVAEQLLQLLGHSKALLTSRHRFTGNLYPLHLDGLDNENAQRLIQQEAKDRQVGYIQAASTTDLQPLIAMTGGSPLAMKLVVGQLGHLSLPMILNQLQNTNSLAYSQSGDTQVSLYQSLYAPSWKALSEDAKRLLIGMTLFIADIGGTVDEVQAICGFSEAKVASTIDELWHLSLVEVSQSLGTNWVKMRYSLHALTQSFVLSEIIGLNAPFPSKSKEYDLFLKNLESGLTYMQAQIQAHSPSLPPLSTRNLTLHMLNYALQIPSLWPITSQVLLLLAPKMEQAGQREDEWKHYLERGIEQSRIAGDGQIEAELSFHLGILQQQRSQYDAAHVAFEAAIHRFEQSKEIRWQAKVMIRQSQIHRLQNQYEEAEELLTVALKLLNEDDIECARGYHVRGCVAHDRQAWEEAVQLFQKALDLWERNEDRRMTAWGLTNLGATYRPWGKYKEAIMCYTRAIVLQDEMQDPLHRAVTQMNLGNVYLDREDFNKALEMYQLAESVFLKVKDELRLATNHNNKGYAYRKMGQWEEAVNAYQESVRLYRQIGRSNSLANALNSLGLSLVGQGHYMEAITAYQDALNHLEQIVEFPKDSNIYKEIEVHLEEALEKLI